MKCTECNEPIPFYEEDVTVRVVYSDGRGIERHCHHGPFDETDPAVMAVLGSQDCLQRWLNKRANSAQQARVSNANN
jgi:hypothetical protein